MGRVVRWDRELAGLARDSDPCKVELNQAQGVGRKSWILCKSRTNRN